MSGLPAQTDHLLGEPELFIECTDCGCEFRVDSSPNLILCWMRRAHPLRGGLVRALVRGSMRL